ncbi:MAG: hypothetical protein ACLQBX_15930 [Candidatus Limnocylindrales bacterium]
MQPGTAWEAFDPTTPALSIVPPATMPFDNRPASGVSFWHPRHELFGFAVLLGITAAALYVTNEHASIGGHVKAGPISAGAEAGI